MPEFRTEIDIEPYEYVDECSRYEIKELINCLVERGYLESHEPVIKEKDSTLEDLEWNTIIDKSKRTLDVIKIEDVLDKGHLKLESSKWINVLCFHNFYIFFILYYTNKLFKGKKILKIQIVNIQHCTDYFCNVLLTCSCTLTN
jgi:hypothetical protein